MKSKLTRFILTVFKALAFAAAGSLAVLVIVFIVYMEKRPDLDVWHTADLDAEFTASSGVDTFADYLALEDRLFRQLDEMVYARTPPEERRLINRYNRGSLSDPERWSPNWNRTFEFPAMAPKAGVLLLHGMSDSPYSLHHLGRRLNTAGAVVLGLRVPGHGTAPSGLVEVTWKDMAAAVRLAMGRLAEQAGGRPLYIVGYSNGAALAVNYAISSIEDETLPKAEKLVLLSPAIGVTSAAALAVWQARLGHLLGLEKLAWNAILPEYDPFKYGSFAVNAGDVVYRLTRRIQDGLNALGKAGTLDRFPPVVAFSSVVDATVSIPALIQGLFERLPAGDQELVLFDINRMAEMDPILERDPAAMIRMLAEDRTRPFTFSLVTNENAESRRVILRRSRSGSGDATLTDLGLAWPDDVYSLSHVAVPFPPEDSLYGGRPSEESPGIQLGNIALRGERGVLQIPAADMLRLRWNPFYSFVEAEVIEFMGLGGS